MRASQENSRHPKKARYPQQDSVFFRSASKQPQLPLTAIARVTAPGIYNIVADEYEHKGKQRYNGHAGHHRLASMGPRLLSRGKLVLVTLSGGRRPKRCCEHLTSSVLANGQRRRNRYHLAPQHHIVREALLDADDQTASLRFCVLAS